MKRNQKSYFFVPEKIVFFKKQIDFPWPLIACRYDCCAQVITRNQEKSYFFEPGKIVFFLKKNRFPLATHHVPL